MEDEKAKKWSRGGGGSADCAQLAAGDLMERPTSGRPRFFFIFFSTDFFGIPSDSFFFAWNISVVCPFLRLRPANPFMDVRLICICDDFDSRSIHLPKWIDPNWNRLPSNNKKSTTLPALPATEMAGNSTSGGAPSRPHLHTVTPWGHFRRRSTWRKTQ